MKYFSTIIITVIVVIALPIILSAQSIYLDKGENAFFINGGYIFPAENASTGGGGLILGYSHKGRFDLGISRSTFGPVRSLSQTLNLHLFRIEKSDSLTFFISFSESYTQTTREVGWYNKTQRNEFLSLGSSLTLRVDFAKKYSWFLFGEHIRSFETSAGGPSLGATGAAFGIARHDRTTVGVNVSMGYANSITAWGLGLDLTFKIL